MSQTAALRHDPAGEDAAYRTFQEAARETVTALQAMTGMGLWMVTRTRGNDWIVLQAADTKYQVRCGQVFRWADSFCSRMVRGEGPRVAPASADVPAYAAAPIGEQIPIGSYVGTPLTAADGGLFGTLCAIDPDPKSPDLARFEPAVRLAGKLLSTVLRAELAAEQAQRRADRLAAEGLHDDASGRLNAAGWARAVEAEQARCAAYGHACGILAVRVRGCDARDTGRSQRTLEAMVGEAVAALNGALRPLDVVARVGKSEAAVLLPHADEAAANAAAAAVVAHLLAGGFVAAVGAAAIRGSDRLASVWTRARSAARAAA